LYWVAGRQHLVISDHVWQVPLHSSAMSMGFPLLYTPLNLYVTLYVTVRVVHPHAYSRL